MERGAGRLAAALLAGAWAGCSAFGGHLQSSPRIGGAEGEVRFRRTPDDNVFIDLSVKHLKDPEKLMPPAWSYVVWVRDGRQSSPLNLGTLTIDKDRTGEFKTVTQLRNFELFVTAEQVGTAENPSGEPLLWTRRAE